MKKDLISIIVPVYNVEAYLERCVDSLINQSYKNIEIILVDDGSKDNSGKLCDELAKNDNRIKVIHKKNGGLSDARNYGLKEISGSYVSFVDSDDDVSSDYVKTLYNLVKDYKTDMSIASFNLINNDHVTNCGTEYLETVMTTEECLSRLFQEKGFNVSACGKLFKISLFDDIKFPKGKLYEDNGTIYKLIMKCKKISYSPKSIYNYYIRENSITNKSFSINKIDYIYFTDKASTEILKKYPNLKDECEFRKAIARFSILRQMLNAKLSKEDKVKENEIICYLKKEYKNLMNNKCLTKKLKYSLILLKVNKWLLKVGANIYEKHK